MEIKRKGVKKKKKKKMENSKVSSEKKKKKNLISSKYIFPLQELRWRGKKNVFVFCLLLLEIYSLFLDRFLDINVRFY